MVLHKNAIDDELSQWEKENKLNVCGTDDATLWTNKDETQWLGG